MKADMAMTTAATELPMDMSCHLLIRSSIDSSLQRFTVEPDSQSLPVRDGADA